MDSLEQHLLNINVVLIAAGAWFLLWVIRKVWPGMDKVAIVKRLKPLYPAILCEGFVWIPGALPTEPEPTIGTRILMGLWCGFLASIGYQLLKRFLGQRGIDLPDKPEDLVSSTDPEGDKPAEEDSIEKPETREQADTPVETPIPRAAKAESEAADDEEEEES